MSYRNRVGGAAVLGGMLLGWACLAGRAESSAPARAPLPRWEYAYVLNSRTQLGTAFNSPRESVRAGTAFELYRKLGGRRDESGFTLADLTSHVGAQGWELVSVDTQDAVAATYWFKRAAE